MPNQRNSYFRRGRGVFSCASCNRRTRDTGANAGTDLCKQCYELAGYYNMLQDGARLDTELATYKEDIIALCGEVEAKGGKLDSAFEELKNYIVTGQLPQWARSHD